MALYLLDASERATKFKEQYLNRLKTLRNQPFAHGTLTVRSLLDMREHCLSEFNFHDPYLRQKQMENDQALALLPERLASLAQYDFEKLNDQLAIGLLAGNVFDWGAKEVALLMESGQGLRFEVALGFIKPRPWLEDDLDAWKSRLRDNNRPHKCAAIFIDNSGADVILGVIPFAVELLRYLNIYLDIYQNRVEKLNKKVIWMLYPPYSDPLKWLMLSIKLSI